MEIYSSKAISVFERRLLRSGNSASFHSSESPPLAMTRWGDVFIFRLARQKEIKGWTREKKAALIATTNPKGQFLVLC